MYDVYLFYFNRDDSFLQRKLQQEIEKFRESIKVEVIAHVSEKYKKREEEEIHEHVEGLHSVSVDNFIIIELVAYKVLFS